jgi:glycosyltransferase 2 family protein
MTPAVKKIIQYVIFFGVSILLLWLSVKDITATDWQHMKASVKNLNYWLIIPVFICSLLSYWARAMRWRLLIQTIGSKTGIGNTTAAVIIGYFANAALPRLGEVLKCTILSKYENVPADKLLGTIVIERAWDVICFSLFICLNMVIEYDKVGHLILDAIKKLVLNNQGEFSYLKFLSFFGIVLLIIFLVRWLFKNHANNKIVKATKGILANLGNGLTSILRLKEKSKFLWYTLLLWSMYLIQIYIAFFAIPETSHLNLGAACSVLTAGSIGMIISANGLGGFPLMVMTFLTAYNIDKATGNAFGWVMWACMTLILILAGIVSFILLPRFNKNANTAKT